MRCLLVFLVVVGTVSCQKRGGNETRKESPPVQPIPKESAVESLSDRVKSHVKQTQLGQMWERYMRDGSSEQKYSMAQAISDRVFGDPQLIMPRITAIKVLVDDLYDDKSRITTEAQSKIQLIYHLIEHRRMSTDRRRIPSFAQALPYFVVVSLLAGSNRLRFGLWSVSQRVFTWFQRAKSDPAVVAQARQSLPPELQKAYSPRKAYSAFMSSAMAYMILSEALGDHGETGENEPWEILNELNLVNFEGL